jgi:two-component system phosphate regulon sensor histidine kinase PhoR
MKKNRTFLFISVSSLALVALLAIQVYWILQTARMKEELFNEKANMVLSRTIEAIGNDETTCGQIQECVRADAMTGSTATLGKAETHTIDSLFNHFMRLYNFHIDYSFVVAKPEISASKGSGFIYNQRLDQVASLNGVELKLIFPDKKDYIMAEMGAPFIASMILILVVLAMFWRTVLSLMKEKKIAEHTTDFLNNMTHEFKTPLTNIALAGKMMVKDSNLRQEEKVKHYSGIILEENEKLRLQVEQVLSMTALERGEIPLEKTELDFHQLILDCTKCMGLQIENGKGKLKLDLEANKVEE